mgnify:CR=1 FL=1
MNRTAYAVVALLTTALFAAQQPVEAQIEFPNRVVKIVTPYAAASVPDILARALAPGLSTKLGQQFIIENRPGASGGLGLVRQAELGRERGFLGPQPSGVYEGEEAGGPVPAQAGGVVVGLQ